jgi:hypothetical protein
LEKRRIKKAKGMLPRAATFLAKAILPVALMGGYLAEAQMNPAGQGPIRMPGSVTNTGFAGALAGTVQGTYPGGGARSPQGLYLGAPFPLAAPYPNWAPAPPAIFDPSYGAAPAYGAPPAPMSVVDVPPLSPFMFAPAPERPTVSVFVAATESPGAPDPISPELRRRNSQNLQALAAVLHFPGAVQPAAALSPSAISSVAAMPAAATAAAASSAETEPLLLIAFKDRNVVTAIAYWTDRGTLHFVTPAREQKHVPLSDVDWERSRALNNERGMPFSVMQ